MHCISLAILIRLSRFPSPAVGTNWPFCVDVPLKHQSTYQCVKPFWHLHSAQNASLWKFLIILTIFVQSTFLYIENMAFFTATPILRCPSPTYRVYAYLSISQNAVSVCSFLILMLEHRRIQQIEWLLAEIKCAFLFVFPTVCIHTLHYYSP